ncbi:C-type lectin BfL-1-like [Drosophila obscura]|uniref:C-type lectin BfL-1-like n=1 Tax=Drosophila obscura TaxID=7282 RepID=UPI001BB14AD4|nr:C-type lectin BfL-1-like [Drosophila obscura]
MLWPKIVSFALVSLCLARVHLAANQESTTSCPTSFSRVGDKCLLVEGSWKNWFEGDRYCRTLNASMLSIRNLTEFNLINSFLPEFASSELELWTSGNSLGNAQTNYFWQSTGKEATYLPWATGQPKKASGDCLSLTANFSMETGEVVLEPHRLTVRNCTLWGAVICETKLTHYKTELCLNPNAFYEAQIPV